jgi:hypothetical protein
MQFCSNIPCTPQEAAAWISGAIVFLGAVGTVTANYLIFRSSITRIGNAEVLAGGQRNHEKELAREEHERQLAILDKQRQDAEELKLYEANLEALKKTHSTIVERLRKFQAAAELAEERARPLTSLQATLAAVRGTPQEDEVAKSIIEGAGGLLRAAGDVFARPGFGEPHLPPHCASLLRKVRVVVIRVLLLLSYESPAVQDPKAIQAQMHHAMNELHKAIIAFSRVVDLEQARIITRQQVTAGPTGTDHTLGVDNAVPLAEIDSLCGQPGLAELEAEPTLKSH